MKLIAQAAVIALLGSATGFAQADCKTCPSECCAQDCCPPGCASPCCVKKCPKTCRAYPDVEKVKKHYWEIELKEICIPRVQLPWSKSCEPGCGKVRVVKVLKKNSYEVEKCTCKWEIDCCPFDGCAGGSILLEEAAAELVAPPTKK